MREEQARQEAAQAREEARRAREEDVWLVRKLPREGGAEGPQKAEAQKQKVLAETCPAEARTEEGSSAEGSRSAAHRPADLRVPPEDDCTSDRVNPLSSLLLSPCCSAASAAASCYSAP